MIFLQKGNRKTFELAARPDKNKRVAAEDFCWGVRDTRRSVDGHIRGLSQLVAQSLGAGALQKNQCRDRPEAPVVHIGPRDHPGLDTKSIFYVSFLK